MMPFSNITSHQDSQDRFTVGEVSGSSHDASGHRGEEPEVFPEAMKVIGILRERLTGGEKWEVSIIFQGPLGEMGFCWSLLCLEWFTWNKCILEAKSDSSWYQKFEARNFWMFCEVSFVSALRQLQCQNYEGWVSPFCWRQVQEPLQDFQMRTTRGGRFFWRQQTGILSNAVTLNLRHGGVQVAESSVEVLKQADIIFKVNEPLLDEVGQKRSGWRRNWSDIVRQQHLLNIKRKPGEMLFECGWVKCPGADASGDSNVAEPRFLWFFLRPWAMIARWTVKSFPASFFDVAFECRNCMSMFMLSYYSVTLLPFLEVSPCSAFRG